MAIQLKRVLLWGAGAVALLALGAVLMAEYRQTGQRAALAPAEGEYVAAGDTRIFLQRQGARDAPAVVFIHGTGSWSGAWRDSMATAQRAGYQAIALDLPPFGFSEPAPNGDYNRVQQADRLRRALDSAGVRQAVFVAHSFGAAPLMEALLADPKRATALVLVDAALGLQKPQTDGKDTLVQTVLRQRWISRPLTAGLLTNPQFTPTLLRSFVTEKDKVTPAWVDIYRQPLALEGSYRHMADWLPELLSARGSLLSDSTDAYAGLRIPVTLVWGETDTITPLSQAQHLQSLVPGATLLRIERAGHIPQIEEPALFQAALAQALGSAPKAAQSRQQ